MSLAFPRFALLRPQVTTRKITDIVDIRTKISFPATFPWISRPYVSSLEALAEVQANAPADGVEVVGWMQGSAAENIVLYGMMEDYNSLRGRLSPQPMVVASGDSYIPGVAVSNDFQFQSIKAEDALASGNVVLITPQGAINMPVNSSQTIIYPNFLGWAAATGFETIQWRGTLVNWQELVSRPIDQGVRCANISGFVCPQFFDIPANGLLRSSTRVVVTSDTPQTITFTGRSPHDYTQSLFEFTQDIEPGSTEIAYTVMGLPRTTHHVLQITPQDGTQTVIDSVQ